MFVHFWGYRYTAFCGFIAAAFLGGCSGSGSAGGSAAGGLPAPAQSQRIAASSVIRGASIVSPGLRNGLPSSSAVFRASLRRTNAVKPGIYVAGTNDPNVYEYAANDQHNKGPRCSVSGATYPNSIGVDKSGVLWIPNQDIYLANSITSYASGCGAPGMVLSDTNGVATGIAFDSKGTKYVLDALTYASGETTGGVSVFPKGQTTSSRTLNTLVEGFAFAVGVDSKDNVYVMYQNAGGTGTVVEFPKGKKPGITLGVKTDQQPGGALIFDKSDNMIVDENNVVGTALVFAPPYKHPSKTYPLMGSSWQCAFNKTVSRLACADQGNNSVDVFSYPSFTYLFSITAGLPPYDSVLGVSYDPARIN